MTAPDASPRPKLERFEGPLVRLIRYGSTPMGTFGRLHILSAQKSGDSLFSCYTIERPWVNNERRVSCIPSGQYQLRKGTFHSTKEPYENYELMAVPGRTYIEIHIANRMTELLGCIGIGTRLFAIGKTWAVKNSKNCHKSFMRHMEDFFQKPNSEGYAAYDGRPPLEIFWALPQAKDGLHLPDPRAEMLGMVSPEGM
jgi:hypothetical protein